MIEIDTIDIDGKKFIGVRININPAPIVLIKGEKGFVMCGALNMEAANKIGMVAASVSGVNSFEDILSKPIGNVSIKARELGIKEGMSGREALKLF